MTDKELLELAAHAAGYTLEERYDIHGKYWPWCFEIADPWSPLTDDGDALRLAIKLRLVMDWDGCLVQVFEEFCDIGNPIGTAEVVDAKQDPYAATRRAIVRAAAEIGKTIGEAK